MKYHNAILQLPCYNLCMLTVDITDYQNSGINYNL